MNDVGCGGCGLDLPTQDVLASEWFAVVEGREFRGQANGCQFLHDADNVVSYPVGHTLFSVAFPH
jgi:hypothetical protein